MFCETFKGGIQAEAERRWKSESWQLCLSLQAAEKASSPEAESQNMKQTTLNLLGYTKSCLPKKKENINFSSIYTYFLQMGTLVKLFNLKIKKQFFSFSMLWNLKLKSNYISLIFPPTLRKAFAFVT